MCVIVFRVRFRVSDESRIMVRVSSNFRAKVWVEVNIRV